MDGYYDPRLHNASYPDPYPGIDLGWEEHRDDTITDHTHRLLAPAGGVPTVDYGVISVVVITLGMVLAIEVLRHRLDTAASGHPFFHTVLELMYRELTTLGIVEFCIYLMHKYHANFNYQMEAIFVDVHFMLFYTAVFNAIQSCFVRLLTGRRTDRSWVQTEDIDTGHYVAIRKEFDRLETKSRGVDAISTHSSTYSAGAEDSQSYSCWGSFRETLRDLSFNIQHPHRSRRRKQLLLPLRFHELRAHFIESNNLPPGFTISHYLKRSLTSVLLDFVHIHSGAWILLMASANLLYFLSGMLLNATSDSLEVEEFLMYIFFALMIIFVVVALALYMKMKSIYSKIMNMKLMIDDTTNESKVRKTWRGALNVETKTKIRDQRDLFWGHNPHNIIVATQFMQFGYALGLAMIFTYYKDFAQNYTQVDPNYLLLALLTSYLIFLHLVTVIIPWYTVCTSMGHMVNKERLNETLAKAKLNEEIRKKESLEEERKAEAEIARRKLEAEARIAEAAKIAQSSIKDRSSGGEREGSAGVWSAFRSVSTDALDAGPGRRSDPTGTAQRKDGRAGMLARSSDPSRSEQRRGAGLIRAFRNPSGDASEEGSGRSWLRHARKKSLSDGVQLMSSIGLYKDVHLRSSGSTSPTGSVRLSSAAAQHLDTADDDEPQIDVSLFKVDPLDRRLHPEPVRHRPRKTVSDNVALMRAMEAPIPNSLAGTAALPSEGPTLASKMGSTTKTANGTPLGKDFYSPSQSSPRSRSNSTDGATKPGTDVGVVINGGHTRQPVVAKHAESPPGREERKQRHRLLKTQSEGVAIMHSSLSKDTRRQSLSPEPDREEGKLATLSELRQMNGTTDPPTILTQGRAERKQRRRLMKTQSEGVAFMRSTLPSSSARSSPVPIDIKGPEKLATLSELTQISAKDLPELPDASQKARPRRRHVRERSASAGVLLMRAGMTDALTSPSEQADRSPRAERLAPMMGSIDEKGAANGGHTEAANALSGHTDLTAWRKERKQRRRRTKTQSEGVAFMRSSLPVESSRSSLDDSAIKTRPEKLATLSELTQMTAKDLPTVPGPPHKVQPRRRHARERSASAGVLLMRTGPLPGKTADTSVPNEGLGSTVATTMPKDPTKAKVTFSLAKGIKGAPTQETSLVAKDTESFDSVASDDGSDIDDVPEALLLDDPIDSEQSKMQAIGRKIGKVDLAAFYQSSRYRIISLIFGPMACFFFVAMRVEIFNIYAGVFVDQTNIWYKYLTPCFWVEVSLYCLMMIEMLSVLVVFLPKRGRDGRALHCFAAVIGILVNIMCLSLLLVAEAQRCCSDNDSVIARLLAPAASESYYSDPASQEAECCPEFGTRRYGGLGNIEPFTSLIALSPLRFIVAGFIAKMCGKPIHEEDSDSKQETAGQHQHGPDPASKVRDLWMAAIGVHSDIAKSFGLFSGELLQCMLGIYSHNINGKQPELTTGETEILDDAVLQSSDQDSSKHPEVDNSLELATSESSRGAITLTKGPATKRYESDDFGVSFDDFAYPRARLIRRMRRCERLLLPYLEEWMAVDVVLTSHELILFDVPDGTEYFESSDENAMSACSNGGKGLHLCDIAKGRRKLHQFNLDDVDLIDIEHRAALPGGNEAPDIERGNRNSLLEYWQGGNKPGDYEASAMNNRWKLVDEDRLKIHCNNVTLYLRFMVDLKEMEHKSKADIDDSDLMNHVGTQTKVWCRTIARLRGPNNLKQHLPHFGNEGTDEIEDFIEMCERDHDDSHHNTNRMKRRLHRRMSSFQH